MRAPSLTLLVLLLPVAHALAFEPLVADAAPLEPPAPTGPRGFSLPPAPYWPGDDVVVPVPRNQDEMSIAANPLDPDHLVGGANDYGQGEVACGVFVSRDGGATWTHGYVPVPAIFAACGDPAIAFGPDGEVYYAGIAFNRNVGPNAIFVSKSVDGGATWTTATPYTHHDRRIMFHDKPWLAVDPHDGTVLVTYTQFGEGSGIIFGKSVDGGATFTPKLRIGSGQFTLPVAGENGEYYVAWRGSGVVHFAVSRDGGASFTVTQPLAMSLPTLNVPWRYGPYPVMDVARGGPHEGRIYLAAPRASSGEADLRVVTSDDGGASWSAPETIPLPGVPVMPWMAIQPDGTVGIAHMLVPSAPVPLVEQVLVTRAPDVPVWRVSVLTDAPTRADVTTFWGDYQGLAATANGFHPAFGDARGAGPCSCGADAALDFATMRVGSVV